MLNKDIDSTIRVYQIVIIIMSLALIGYLIIIKFWWTKRTAKKMYSEINEIKTILQLVSYK